MSKSIFGRQQDAQVESSCMSCLKVFRTTKEFDRHRVAIGNEAYPRRCLLTAEMRELGWEENGRYWRSPEAKANRERFRSREDESGMAIAHNAEGQNTHETGEDASLLGVG